LAEIPVKFECSHLAEFSWRRRALGNLRLPTVEYRSGDNKTAVETEW
jgi:hypothetical protein